MPVVSDCIRLITQARIAAESTESAYLLRARLKRSILSAARLACANTGEPDPVFPGDIEQLDLRDPQAAKIVRVCVSLLAKTKTLCQPSEALDSRWKTGWEIVRVELAELEQAVAFFESSVN
jgi:hypothetical protein